MRPRRRPSPSTSPTMITPFRSLRRRSANRSVLLALTGAGLFLASLDAYVVVTALLPMLKSVNIAVNRPEQATPIITGFLLGYLAVMPIAGGQPRRDASLDWLGALLATAGLALLTLALYAANPEQSPVGEGFFWQAPLALLCFGLFVWHEHRTPQPLINVRRFRDSSFTGSALTNAIAGAGLMVALVYIPVLANAVFSMNASGAALLLFRLMLGIPIGPLLGGFLAQRLRSYRAVGALGLLLAAAGFYLLSGWNEGSLKPHLLGLPFTVADGELFLTGLGLGIEIAPVSAALLDAVGEAERGAGASFLIIMRLVGMLVGFSLVAGFGLWEFHRATAHLLPPLPGLNPNFATQFAIYAGKVKGAIFDEYHLIFRSTAIALFIGALLAAATLRPLPRPRWR